MAQLNNLPDELLVKIFTHVSDVEHSALLQLALVNKRLSKIVSPLLVRRWPAHDTDKGKEIEHLAIHLLRHPELRDQVRSIRWDTDCSAYSTDRKDDQDLWKACQEAFPDLAPGPGEEEEEGPRLPDMDFSDIIATLVFTWAKNLTELTFTVQETHEYPDTTIYRNILQTTRALTNPEPGQALEHLPFAELREVSFRHCDTWGSFNGTWTASFFLLPKLKSFSGFYFGLWDMRMSTGDLYETHEVPETILSDDTGMPDFPIGTSPVETIIMLASEVSVAGLMLMVRACRRLKMLAYEPHPDCWRYQIGLRSLAHVMLLHASSLEEVMIRIPSPAQIDTTEEPWEGSVPLQESFRQLANLKTLTMALDFLFDTDEDGSLKVHTSRLPSSIGHLRLENVSLILNWSRFLDEIEAVATGLGGLVQESGPDGRFKNLKKIDLYNALIDDPNVEVISRLKELAEERGIALSFYDPELVGL
ncbi:hypothetical protein ACHAPT_010855 [Fusarium lateritium]